jgi:2-epi-valiolone-7-phosphate 1-reductase
MIENLALVRDGLEFRTERRTQPSTDRVFRILRASVCGTDVQICRRIRPDSARILGHECLAEALDVGAREERLVVFNPVDRVDQDKILGHSYDGAFQRYLIAEPGGTLPETCGVSPELIADLAPLIEPLAAVLYGWELVETAGELRSAAVFGGGATAALAVLTGSLRGVEMTLVHSRPARLRFLESVLPAPDTHFVSDPASDAGKVDAAFICVPREGAPTALSSALSRTRQGGVIDLLGGVGTGDRHAQMGSMDLGLVRRVNVRGERRPGVVIRLPSLGIGVTGHRGTSMAHLDAAQRLLRDHSALFGPLVTHVLSLESAAAFLSAVSCGSRTGGLAGERIKIVIDPTLGDQACRARDLDTTAKMAAVAP